MSKNKCNLDNIPLILTEVDAFFFEQDPQNWNKDFLNMSVWEKIPGENQEFSISAYADASIDFKNTLIDKLVSYGANVKEFLTIDTGTEKLTKSNSNSDFSSGQLTDLFHTLPLVKTNFESSVNGMILSSIFIGDPNSKKYVETDDEINNNFIILKNKLFRDIQNFLVSVHKLKKSEIKSLYDKNSRLIDYDHYKRILDILSNFFFREDNYPLISSYTNKKIPNLSLNISENEDIFNAYNAGILLSNFDTVIKEYYPDIININYNWFNVMDSTIDGFNKYSLKIKGLENPYWMKDTHDAESSEAAETKLAKLLVSTIPYKNKKGIDLNIKMEMKDFYLFAAMLSDYENIYGLNLKHENIGFLYFNEDPKKALLWYVDNIMNAVNNKPGSIQSLKAHFEKNYEFALSLQDYINSKEFNILIKEDNSTNSLLTIFAQIINNNFGATYYKYNKDGKYTVQQMYSQNFNNIHFQNTTLSYLRRLSKKDVFNSDKIKEELDILFKNVTDDNLMQMPIPELISIAKYIKTKTGISLSYLGVRDLIADFIPDIQKRTITSLKNGLTVLMSKLKDDMSIIASNESELQRFSTGDVTASEYIPNTISNALYKSLMDAALKNQVMKPAMNVTTFSGEKLPTFKIATLCQKDAELFELQRKFELENKSSIFKSLITKNYSAEENKKPAFILGTGTELELVAGDENKSAVQFNVSEHFTVDFQFNFLQSIINNGTFSILLGNYSDKNTILTKIINGNLKLPNTKSKVSLVELPIEEILQLVRNQGAAFYKSTLQQIISDYAVILNKPELKTSSILDAINKINEILKEQNVRDLSIIASNKGISFTDELHFSKYANGIRLNQFLIDNFNIFTNEDIFNTFISIQEQNFLDKYKTYNKDIADQNKLRFTGSFNIDKAIKALNINTALFDEEIREEESNKSSKLGKDYTKLVGKSGLNPLVKKWLWLNALSRNEYLFVTAKGEYMHPHKIRGFVSRDSDLGFKSGTAEQKAAYWEQYNKEMSGRLISMAKRNVLFTATIEVPVRKSQLGVPEQVNHAVIEDYTDTVFNLSGDVKKQEVHDGSSFINYVYSLLINNSFPAKGFSGTKKQFASLITPYGVTIKKDAESEITNDKILNSKNSAINFYNIQKQMLSTSLGITAIDFKKNFNNQYFFNELGTLYRIDAINLKKNKTYELHLSKKINGEFIEAPFRSGNYDSLFDIWKLFGAQFSTDENNIFNEGSNDFLYELVTTPDSTNNYPLKMKMIHVVSSLSAVKAGATNVNPKSAWTTDIPLAYFTFENRFMGPQLDPSHTTNDSEVKEVTQVISALAQNTTTAHLAAEAYENIANVIKQAARPYLKYMRMDNLADDRITSGSLYKYIAEKFVKTVTNSKGDTIAKVLLQSFSNDVNIPFSNQNFFVPFVRDIITRMNNEFITRYYSGTGAVLIPSHGIIQLYDIPQPDGSVRTVTQADLAKEALSAQNISQIVTKENKVVWAHPGIGKTFLHEQGNKDTIDFDSIYKSRINTELGLPSGPDVKAHEARKKWRATNPEAWNQKIRELWNEAKKDAKVSGKTLLASDIMLLNEFSNDFDKIINMPTDVFIERSKQRGETDVENKLKWKSNIDAALANISPEKITTSTKYMSEIWAANNDQIITNYINDLLPPLPTTWDKIRLGDTILVNKLPRVEAIEVLKIGNYKEQLINYLRELFPPEDLELGVQQLMSRFLDWNYGNNPLPSFEKIAIEFEAKIGVFLAEDALNTASETIEQIPVSLSTPSLYYKYKKYNSTEEVTKLTNVPRDLRPSEMLFTVNGIEQNIFDLDSIKLRYFLHELGEGQKLDITSPQFNTLQAFVNYLSKFNKNFIDLNLADKLLSDLENTSKILSFYLNLWTNRNLELLDNNIVMKSINEVDSFETLFNGDNLRDVFTDAKEYYNIINATEVQNYTFNPAELILGDIYQSKFNRNLNDSVYEIKKLGEKYFRQKFEDDFKEDSTKADIKLVLNNHPDPIYIRYVDRLPGNDYRINFTTDTSIEDDDEGTKFVRRNQDGDILYKIPNNNSVRVILENGKEIINIKAVNKITDKDGNTILKKTAEFELDTKRLFKSFRDNIRSFVPLMNNKLNGKFQTIEENKPKLVDFSLNSTTLQLFSKFTNFAGATSKFSDDWFIKNKEILLDQLSKKMYTSWEKSHEFVAARIPAQSMQSFMEMRNIAYMNTTSNDAYVSVWQIWLQGSDFDIDKAYLIGSGFTSSGGYDSWTGIDNYSTKAQLNEIERMPLPKNIKASVAKVGETAVDLSEEINKFYKFPVKAELTIEQLESLNSALRILNTVYSNELEEQNNKIKPTSIEAKITGEDEKLTALFAKQLNLYNENTEYKTKRNALKNLVVSTIKQIISKPSNQILANTPVNIDELHEAANEAMKKNNKIVPTLSSYDMFSFYKQQRDAAVGKDDVGIAANGLKVFFALSSYYNTYFSKEFNTENNLSMSNKLFNKEFNFIKSDGTIQSFKFGTISDINITKSQVQAFSQIAKDIDIRRSLAAINLSAFTSAATDNAKELLMAKINATAELASMHIYLMILGLTPIEIADIMTSSVMEDVVERLESNIFFSDDTTYPSLVFDKIITNSKDPATIQNAKTLKDIYEGAQEVKLLASLLAANQKTSANILEINKYLTKFETAIYARENNVFKRDLKNFEYWEMYKNSTDIIKADKAKKMFNDLVNQVFENNKLLNKATDLDTVTNILTRAAELKIVGGKFDFQSYFKEGNSEYKTIAKQYYNLIKHTFNIFDVIDKVPHFKEMINSVVLTHDILSRTSIKYNTVFTLLKNTMREQSHRIVIKANPHIKNQMGNPSFYPKITDAMVSKGLAGIDIRLKSEWLKSSSTDKLSFNVNELLKQLNVIYSSQSLPPIKEFQIYTSDDAREESQIANFSRIVTPDDDIPTIINLKTNYGIANFKKIMEELLLPIVQSKSNILTDSLRVQGGVFNILGIKTNTITSTFSLSSLSSPIAKDQAQKLIKAFNDLDLDTNSENTIKNSDGKELKWRDLFYVYNLLVNNEKYGDVRLTPLFEDYVKETRSLGYDYVMYSAKIDKGDLKLYDLERTLLNDPEYIAAVNSNDTNTINKLKNKIQRELENDILFYSLNRYGRMAVMTDKTQPEYLSVTNGDFIVVTSITETPERKRSQSDLYDIIKLIKERGFIIKFEC